MRASWIRNLEVQENYCLRDEGFHHLVHVVRIKINEPLLLLDGQGLCVETVVETISKKELKLRLVKQFKMPRSYTFDLVLGLPKKEAFELCIKEVTELGFRRVYLVRTDYSQIKVPELERIEKLLVSALEQSNAPYLPEISESVLEDIPWNNYAEVLLLDSQTKASPPPFLTEPLASRLLVVGPEGGFSPSELQYFHAKSTLKVINLPTPILRTPTAVATGAGVMMISLLK